MDYEPSRTVREIGDRSLILGFILSAFNLRGQEAHDFGAMVKAAEAALAPSDKELLFRGDWSEEVQRDLLWQVECLHILLWGLGRHTEVLAVDRMINVERIVSEINVMGRDVEAWRASLSVRTAAELDGMNELLDFWLWRSRDGSGGGKPLSPAARSAVSGAVERGVLLAKDVSNGDVVAFGAPYYKLSHDQQQRVAAVVRERVRAIRWIWRDFDDWWAPDLDS